MKTNSNYLVLVFLFISYACLSQPAKPRSVVVKYKGRPKVQVDCEVRKVDRDSKEISIGMVQDSRFTFSDRCLQGEKIKFHPISSNYIDVVKFCGFKEDTINLLDRDSYATLFYNSSVLPRFDDVPKKYYAISAIASQELLNYNDLLSDTIIKNRNSAIRLYYNFEPHQEFNVQERVAAIKRDGELNISFTLSHNFVDSIVAHDFKKSITGNFHVSNYLLGKENGDLRKAVIYTDRSIETEPQNYMAYYNKAVIMKALGDKKGALVAAQKGSSLAKRKDDNRYFKLNEDLIRALK